jgi:hypothetical protein
VRDRPKAEALAGAASATGATGAAFDDGFLLIGLRARGQRRPGPPPAHWPMRRPTTGRGQGPPGPGRTLDAYASAAGLHELLKPPLRTVLDDRPGLKAIGAALSSADHGARVTARAVGADLKAAAFEPRLTERVPADVAAYIGLGGGSELQALAAPRRSGTAARRAARAAEREAGVAPRPRPARPAARRARAHHLQQRRPPGCNAARATRGRPPHARDDGRLQVPVAAAASARREPGAVPDPADRRNRCASCCRRRRCSSRPTGLDKDTLIAVHAALRPGPPAPIALAENPHFGEGCSPQIVPGRGR